MVSSKQTSFSEIHLSVSSLITSLLLLFPKILLLCKIILVIPSLANFSQSKLPFGVCNSLRCFSSSQKVLRYFLGALFFDGSGRLKVVDSYYFNQKKRAVKYCPLLLVGVTGFEPTTSWSRTMRATNCATPR